MKQTLFGAALVLPPIVNNTTLIFLKLLKVRLNSTMLPNITQKDLERYFFIVLEQPYPQKSNPSSLPLM